MAGWGRGLGWGAVRVTEHLKLRSLEAAAAWPSARESCPSRPVRPGTRKPGVSFLGQVVLDSRLGVAG